jgi:hypothetical protein
LASLTLRLDFAAPSSPSVFASGATMTPRHARSHSINNRQLDLAARVGARITRRGKLFQR